MMNKKVINLGNLKFVEKVWMKKRRHIESLTVPFHANFIKFIPYFNVLSTAVPKESQLIGRATYCWKFREIEK